MPHVVGGADARAAVVRGGLDVDAPERRLVEDLAVHHAVERHAAGEAEIVDARSLVELPQHPEDDLLEPSLEGRRHVLVVRLQRRRREPVRGRVPSPDPRAAAARATRRPTSSRRPRRGAGSSRGRARSRGRRSGRSGGRRPGAPAPRRRRGPSPCTRRRTWEAEVLRDGRVEDAEGVGNATSPPILRWRPSPRPTSRSPCRRTRRSRARLRVRTARRRTRSRCARRDARRSAASRSADSGTPRPSASVALARRIFRRFEARLVATCRPARSFRAWTTRRPRFARGLRTGRSGRCPRVGDPRSRGSSGSSRGGTRCRA